MNKVNHTAKERQRQIDPLKEKHDRLASAIQLLEDHDMLEEANKLFSRATIEQKQ